MNEELQTEIIEEEVRPTFTFKHVWYTLFVTFILFPLIVTLTKIIVVALQVGDIAENMDNLDPSTVVIITVISGLIFTFVLMRKFKDLLRYDFKVFKDNFKPNMKKILKNFLISFLVMASINGVLLFLGLGESANEEAIDELSNALPFVMAISIVIVAPITEEIMFRGGYMKGLAGFFSERTAIIVSSLLFGAIHVVGLPMKSLWEILHLLSYTSIGYFLGKSYRDTDSIWGGIIHHSIHNSIALVLGLLIGAL